MTSGITCEQRLCENLNLKFLQVLELVKSVKATHQFRNKMGTSQVGAISKAEKKYSRNNIWKDLENNFFPEIVFLKSRTMPITQKEAI